jgi:plasmid maintenance system antidote protein VapI
MIHAFRHRGLRQLFKTGSAYAVSADLTWRLIRQLDFLNRATVPRDVRALDTSPDMWLGLQQDIDLREMMQANKSVYERSKPLKAA